MDVEALLSPFVLKVTATVLAAALIAGLSFIWKLPKVLDKLTAAIAKFEKSFELATERTDKIEERVDIADQIFSELAETGVSTKLIAEGKQKPPKFPFKRRKENGEED